MSKIYKFELAEFSLLPVTIKMPRNAAVLSAQEQAGSIQLWAMVDPDNELEERKFLVVGTGWEIKIQDDIDFVATVQISETGLVFHVFEVVGN